MPIRVSTPAGKSVVVEKVYRSCLVNFVRSGVSRTDTRGIKIMNLERC